MKTMLVPLDGSALSETVLPVATAVAGVDRYGVTLFSVWEVLPEELNAIGERHGRELCQQGMKYFRSYLSNIAESLRQKGIEVTVEVRSGHPAVETMRAAVELQVDMIAMTTHGRQGVVYERRGSVADKVLRGSAIPVLVVGPRMVEVWPPAEVKIRSILIPLDGSSESEFALPLAMELAGQWQARVSLLRVVPPLMGSYEIGTAQGYPPEVQAKRLRAAARYLRGIKGRYPQADIEVHLEEGLPRREVPRFSEGRRFDLVVMASRSRYGWGRWSLGGVAEEAIEGSVPVILVPPFQHQGGGPA